MLQFDEYKVKLNNLRPELDELDQALGLETAIREVEMLESESASDGFWDNLEKAQKVQQRVKQLRDKIEGQQRRKTQWDDLMTLCELGNEAEDETLVPEVEEGFAKLEAEIEEASCPLCSPASMTAPMPSSPFTPARAAPRPRTGRRCSSACTPAGRSATATCARRWTTWTATRPASRAPPISIEGENAYGHLKSEHGVHRLVRVSPFDANARRQTSFAALEVMPEIPDDVEVDIRPEDVEMQVFRSSGAGGQHINKTSSAVRLIHKPTGIVVSCQTERSQFQNRDTCMRMLRSKLVELQMQAHAEKISDIKGVQLKIEWGSQIRSYVFMPYQLVKDNRTGYETSNINAVMDGELDGFINAYLKAEATGNWAEK